MRFKASRLATGESEATFFPVIRPSHVLLFTALLACAGPAGRAAVLVHEYALRGTLDDNQAGPALTSMGGQITALGYVFAANQGLTLSSTAFSATSFSIELSFRFDTISGYRKIADFHDRADDTGFYVLNGALNFYPVVTAPTADIAAGTDVHVVLTRDGATNTVVGYLNGQQAFTFADTNPLATLTSTNQKLTLFADDFATGQGEASGGVANFVRIYQGALTASEVSALYMGGAPIAVPEPSTLTLLAGGAGIMLLRGKLRRRKK